MSFYLKYNDCIPYNHIGCLFAQGQIKIGSFQESFSSALNVLSKMDYMTQWFEAITRIEQGYGSSAFLANYVGLEWEVIGMWWPLYYSGDNKNVWIQNQLILQNEVDKNFTVGRYHEYISKHKQTNEEGETISEWNIAIEELVEFKDKLLLKIEENRIT